MRRRGVSLLEVLIAVLIMGIVMLATWALVTQGSQMNADTQALTEIVRAQALLDSVIGGDLDRLVVEPGCRPAGIGDQGRSLSLYIGRAIPDRPYATVQLEPVVFATSVRPDRTLALTRNGRPVGSLNLAEVRFDQVQSGSMFRVSARIAVLGAASTWRPGSPAPGVVWETVRAYTTPRLLPALVPRLTFSGVLPGP